MKILQIKALMEEKFNDNINNFERPVDTITVKGDSDGVLMAISSSTTAIEEFNQQFTRFKESGFTVTTSTIVGYKFIVNNPDTGSCGEVIISSNKDFDKVKELSGLILNI